MLYDITSGGTCSFKAAQLFLWSIYWLRTVMNRSIDVCEKEFTLNSKVFK